MLPSTQTGYRAFLEAKLTLSRHSGFAVPAEAIHPMLKPHQRDIVRWTLHGGRQAIFAAFGPGKSFMQLECLRQIRVFRCYPRRQRGRGPHRGRNVGKRMARHWRHERGRGR